VRRLLKGDLPPGTNKAMLILGDGTTVALDSAKNGTLAKQGYTQVLKVGGGELTYEPTTVEVGDSALVYNTVATPRGGEYRVVLPDGSRVWLNAASSIRFPTAFKGKDREVELTGEAYFEVAANPKQPFHVRVNDMQVKVLGTCFDVMAYEDEASITTSLLQGAVRVEQGGASDLLKPGQGVSLNRLSGEMKIAPADTDQVVAWKNGLFLFEGVTIDRVMRQLARWYDIEVVYDGQMSKHYSGGFSRNASLEEVLRVLQLGVKGRFVLEGKTVRVQSL
jgi:transmembrane sensor